MSTNYSDFPNDMDERAMVLRMRGLEYEIATGTMFPVDEKKRMIEELRALRAVFETDHHCLTEAAEASFPQLKEDITRAENVVLEFAEDKGEKMTRNYLHAEFDKLPSLYAQYARSLTFPNFCVILDNLSEAEFNVMLRAEIAKEAAAIVNATAKACGIDHLVHACRNFMPGEPNLMHSGVMREIDVFKVRVNRTWGMFHRHHIARLESLPPVDDTKSEVLKAATRLGRAALLRKLKKELEDGAPSV